MVQYGIGTQVGGSGLLAGSGVPPGAVVHIHQPDGAPSDVANTPVGYYYRLAYEHYGTGPRSALHAPVYSQAEWVPPRVIWYDFDVLDKWVITPFQEEPFTSEVPLRWQANGASSNLFDSATYHPFVLAADDVLVPGALDYLPWCVEGWLATPSILRVTCPTMFPDASGFYRRTSYNQDTGEAVWAHWNPLGGAVYPGTLTMISVGYHVYQFRLNVPPFAGEGDYVWNGGGNWTPATVPQTMIADGDSGPDGNGPPGMPDVVISS